LIVSELPLFANFFQKNWPMLSINAGFATLGSAMLVIGVTILGDLNKPANQPDKLGMPFWRIVIASGCLITIMGFANVAVVRTSYTSISTSSR
jgi:hypothetical protein